MSLALLFHYLMLNMFRMLMHPSSGACDLFVISWAVLLWFDVCWCYVVVWLWWCGIRMQTEACIRIPHQACIRIPHHPSHPGRTSPPGKTRYPFYWRLGGPQGRSVGAEILVPTGIRSRTVKSVVSRYAD